MSITNRTILCGTCNEAYTDTGAHQFQALDCGHGACKSCAGQMVAQAAACPVCHVQVTAPIPNYDLIEKMSAFSTAVVKQTAQYQADERAKDEKIVKTDSKLKALRQKMFEEKERIVAGVASELVAKAQELVELGLFPDIEQAKGELTAKMNATAKTSPTAQTPKGDEKAAPTRDTTISCVICMDPYTEAGERQPVSLGCGHGACGSCVSRLASSASPCHVCRAAIHAPRPNYALIEQMRQAADDMKALAITHQNAVESKDQELTKLTTQANTIKEKLKKHVPMCVVNYDVSSSTSTSSTSNIVNLLDYESNEEESEVESKQNKGALPKEKQEKQNHLASSIATTTSSTIPDVDDSEQEEGTLVDRIEEAQARLMAQFEEAAARRRLTYHVTPMSAPTLVTGSTTHLPSSSSAQTEQLTSRQPQRFLPPANSSAQAMNQAFVPVISNIPIAHPTVSANSFSPAPSVPSGSQTNHTARGLYDLLTRFLGGDSQ